MVNTKAIAKICRILVYLIETRDERKKGNKLAPEQILFAVLEHSAEGRNAE